ncbi:hypothetical protein [Nocardia sp. NPDC057455]|uniref:hypothetical protein n=1 Tax=Nocardia sp. NPDC057455 TaxID=3346138 RepID=UPI0036736246
MTENTNEAIWYAIRLPGGKLANDLPDVRCGYPKMTELPGGTHVYLWDNDTDPVRTIRAIQVAVKTWGLADLFEANAEVVQVRLSYQILDGNEPAPLPEYHALPDGAEKRIRSLISVLEEAQQRDPDWPVNVPALIRQLRLTLPDPSTVEDEPAGESEPRTWKSAAEVPNGASFRAVNDGDSGRTWRREQAFRALWPHGEGELYDLSEIDHIGRVGGFVEVPW